MRMLDFAHARRIIYRIIVDALPIFPRAVAEETTLLITRASFIRRHCSICVRALATFLLWHIFSVSRGYARRTPLPVFIKHFIANFYLR